MDELQLESGEYPHTAALFGAMPDGQAAEQVAIFAGGARRFERGLAALLDAVAVSVGGGKAGRTKKRKLT